MSSPESFDHESLEDAESIAKYLDALKESLLAGKLHLESDDGELRLQPRGLLGWEVRAKKKGGEVRLRLKLSWREEAEREAQDGFKLSAK